MAGLTPGRKSSGGQNLFEKLAKLKNVTKRGKSEIGCEMLEIWQAADGMDGDSG